MGGAGQVAPAGHPVEQAHDPLDDSHVGPVRPVAEQRRHQLVADQPGVEVAAGRPAGGGVVGGVDVVGPDLVRETRAPGPAAPP